MKRWRRGRMDGWTESAPDTVGKRTEEPGWSSNRERTCDGVSCECAGHLAGVCRLHQWGPKGSSADAPCGDGGLPSSTGQICSLLVCL